MVYSISGRLFFEVMGTFHLSFVVFYVDFYR